MNDYSFGNYILELRKNAGLSQSELAEAVGVSNKAVSKWEVGKAKPGTDTIRKLSALFQVSIEELLKKKEEEKPSAKSVEPVVVRDSSGNIREIHDVANGTRVYVQQTETEKKPGFFQRLFGKKKHKAKE